MGRRLTDGRKGAVMISIKRILCPVDFFPASDAAVSYAAGLASNYDAKVHLLHVIKPIVSTAYEYAIDTIEIMKAMEQSSAEETNKLAVRGRAAGATADVEIRAGDVYDEIKK